MSKKGRTTLFIVNPKSGSGTALSLIQNAIISIQNEIDGQYEIIKTQRSKRGEEVIRDIDISNFSKIIVLGGDGTLHEVINGLIRSHNDPPPLGVLPCGCGNGLASSIFFTSKRKHMTETIANGNTIRVPLLRVDGAKNEHIFSFMSITWGLIADIDRGSEPLRFLSSSRFDIASILYIINRKLYKGRLSFLPYDQNDKTKGRSITIDEEIPSNWQVIERNFIGFIATLIPLVTTSTFADRDPINEERDYIHLQFFTDDMTRLELLRFSILMKRGEHLCNEKYRSLKTRIFRFESDEGHLMIDGEYFTSKKVQAEISDRKIQIFV